MGVLGNGHLVTCSNEDTKENTVRIWNTSTGQVVKSIPTKSRSSRSLLVLSNQSIAIGCQDGRIKIIDSSKSDDQAATILRHGQDVFSLLQLPNSYLVSSGSSGIAYNDIKIWNLENGRLVQSIFTGQSIINSISYHPASNLISSGSSDKSVKVWQLSYD